MRILAAMCLLAACGGGPLVQTGDGGVVSPGALRLDGLRDGALSLGDVPLGADATAALFVQNPGPGPLDLKSVVLEGDGLRWASAPRVGVLAAGAATQLVVGYRGRRDESVRGQVRLFTDAPGQEEVVVPVAVEGLAPRLIMATVIEVGERTVGCRAEVAVPVWNTGRLPLRLWGADADGAVVGEVPASLPPGADAQVVIAVDAVDAGRSKVLLTLRTDDPGRPLATTTVSWVGTEAGLARAELEQSGDGQIDVIFAVPVGEADLRARLAEALPPTLSALDDAGLDWRIALVSGIGGPPPVRVQAGEGDALPRLLDALGPIDAPEPTYITEAARRFMLAHPDFRRPRAGLRLVFVGVGDDPSFGLFEADELVAGFQADAVQPQDVLARAIVPLGDCAAPAEGVGALAEALGGSAVDACTPDWAPPLADLAAPHRAATFLLPAPPPEPSPVWVDVSGVPAVGWTVDGPWLRFEDGVVPPNGATVDVRWVDAESCAP